MFVAVLFVLMLLMVSFSFFEDERPIVRWSVYITAIMIITLMAGLRPIGIDKDSYNYVGYYLGTSDETVENSFLYISDFVRYTFDDVQWVFIIYALIAIPLKCFVFTKLSNDFFMLMAVYMCNFMMLHDMTQIRIGAAMAFVFLGFYYLVNDKKILFIIFTLIASFFHISAILILLILLFRNNDLKGWHRIFLAVIPFITFLAVALNIDIVSLIPFDFIQSKLQIYENLRDKGITGDEKVNLLKPALIVKLMAYYLVLWKYNVLKEYCPYLTRLIKIFAFSYFCYGLLSFMPILAQRVNELFCFVEICMVPLLIHSVAPRWAGRVFVLVYTIGIFVGNLVFAELLQLNM
jgi:hypothetical protein